MVALFEVWRRLVGRPNVEMMVLIAATGAPNSTTAERSRRDEAVWLVRGRLGGGDFSLAVARWQVLDGQEILGLSSRVQIWLHQG
jgi:hypothetical protein